MSNLFDHRRETYGLMDPLDGINDTRNGILLQLSFHASLNGGEIAFLKPGTTKRRASGEPLDNTAFSTTSPVVTHLGHHNSDARQPQDINEWPIAIIVDLSYAATALQTWGPKPFIKFVRTNSQDRYYKRGDSVDEDEDKDASQGLTAQVPDQWTARDRRYQERCKRKQADDPADKPTREDMFDMVLALWMHSASEAASERRPPGSDAANVANNKQKVQTWLQSMEGSTS